VIRQAFGQESMSRAWEVQIHQDRKRKKKKRANFIDTNGSVHKEFVPECQTIDSAYYFDVLRQMRENV
jgi:hypothetical protein